MGPGLTIFQLDSEALRQTLITTDLSPEEVDRLVDWAQSHQRLFPLEGLTVHDRLSKCNRVSAITLALLMGMIIPGERPTPNPDAWEWELTEKSAPLRASLLQ